MDTDHQMTQTVEMPDAEDAILALGFPSDRLYLLSSSAHYYVFTYVGSELNLKEKLIPDKAPGDEDRGSKHRKDIWLEKAEIQDFRLIMKHSSSAALPNNAVVKLRTSGGKRYTMIHCAEASKTEYLRFFSEVASQCSGQRSAQSEERERRREMRRQENEALEERYIRENSGKRTERGSKLARAACKGLMVLDILLALFADRFQTSVLILGLLSQFAALYLIWRYPMYFSLRDKEDKLGTKAEERKNNMILQVFLPAAAAEVAALGDVHYEDVPRALAVSALFIVLQLWLFFGAAKKQWLKKSNLVCFALLIALFGCGLPLGLNQLLADPVPSMTEYHTVREKNELHGKHSSYRLTLENDVEYEVSHSCYERVSEGDRVELGFWNGGLWIPYSKVVEKE